jgi:DNA-binding NarL/FixJ family response regulator
MQKITNISIIEDDKIYADSFKNYINSFPTLKCSDDFNSMEEFENKAKSEEKFDIIFVDNGLPGLSGVKGIPLIKERFPTAEIVMLTVFEEASILIQAFAAGASSYILKTTPMMRMKDCIDIILKDGAVISPTMAKKLVTYIAKRNSLSEDTKTNFLSEKDITVLRLFSEGKSYNVVANHIGISVDGVRYHVKKIYKALNVNNKMEAINKYRTNDLP